MPFSRIIAFILLAVAVLLAGTDLTLHYVEPSRPVLSVGRAWYMAHTPSLNLTQAVVQRYIWSPIWDDVFLPVLRLPLWLFLSIVGGILVYFSRTRRL